MTDIDAIRNCFAHCGPENTLRSVTHEQRMGYAALAAYDAKCEELAALALKVEDRDNAICAMRGTRNEMQRVLMAAEAERDAAVRERDGLREALKEARPVIERAELLLASFARKPTMAAYKADVLSTGMNLAHSLAAIDAQLAALSQARP